MFEITFVNKDKKPFGSLQLDDIPSANGFIFKHNDRYWKTYYRRGNRFWVKEYV